MSVLTLAVADYTNSLGRSRALNSRAKFMCNRLSLALHGHPTSPVNTVDWEENRLRGAGNDRPERMSFDVG